MAEKKGGGDESRVAREATREEATAYVYRVDGGWALYDPAVKLSWGSQNGMNAAIGHWLADRGPSLGIAIREATIDEVRAMKGDGEIHDKA